MSSPAAMSAADVLAGIAALGRERLGFTGPLTPETRLVEDLQLDSVRLLTLAIEIENRFRVRIAPDEEAGVTTLGDLVAIVHGKLADAGG
jgi:acyl carrier protein